MTEIQVIVTGHEEAYDNEAEFGCARQLKGSPFSTPNALTSASTHAPIARRGW